MSLTLISDFNEHIAVGRYSPGLFVLRPGAVLADVLDLLVLVAHASDPAEWRDRVEFIPW
jgi:hypothetical protein